MTFGEFVKTTREQQGLSHRALARRAGIATTTLLYIENGQTQDPRLSLLVTLYMALGVQFHLPGGIDDVPVPLARRRHPLPGAVPP